MKNDHTLCVIVLFLLGQLVVAQPNIAFQKNYGSTQNDVSYAIKQTNDGGYVLAGYAFFGNGDVTNHNGQNDFWIVKTDIQGDIQWEKSYGGTSAEMAYSIQQTSDNGYIVTGVTESVNGDITENFGYTDIWVLKLDSSGSLQWQKSYGDDDNERAWEILQTNDGGYVLTGISWINTSHKDFVVNKIDAAGNLEWQNIFGYNDNSSQDEAHSIKQTADGGFIVVGQTIVLEEVLNTTDYWVVKLDSQGVIEWNERYGGTNIDNAWHVQQTADGGYIVVGNSFSNDEDVSGNNGADDFWVIKLGSDGTLQWEKSYGGSGSERAFSVIQSNDGNYLVAGYTNSSDGDITINHGGNDGWVIKIDTSGSLVWEKTFGGSESDYFRSIEQTSNGGYAISGSISSENIGLDLHGGSDYWFVCLESETLGITAIDTEDSISVYPNPTSNMINIKTPSIISSIALYDFSGKKVIYKNQDTNHINVNHLKGGLYFLKVVTNDSYSTKKIIIN